VRIGIVDKFTEKDKELEGVITPFTVEEGSWYTRESTLEDLGILNLRSPRGSALAGSWNKTRQDSYSLIELVPYD